MKINIHTSHPSAFISSTFLDLEQERNAVASALKESNLNINALDVKPASNSSSREEILTGIKESDFIILIIGERYGSIIPRMTQSRQLSITRWEYVKAVKNLGKHALVYFKRVGSKDPKYFDDLLHNDFQIKRMYLEDFKKELSRTHSPKYFTTTKELAEEVRKAIIPTYRTGVQLLTRINASLEKEVETLKKENQRLRSISEPIKNLPRLGLIGLAPSSQQGLSAGIHENRITGNDIMGLRGLSGNFTNRETKK